MGSNYFTWLIPSAPDLDQNLLERTYPHQMPILRVYPEQQLFTYLAKGPI